MLGFLATALAVRYCERYEASTWKSSIQIFLLYTLTISGLTGFTQREAWPISNWKVFGDPYIPPVQELVILAVDSHGREHLIDRRAWEPFDSLQLHAWLRIHIPRLAPALRHTVCQYLLHLVNMARARAVASQRPGTDGRFLGPLAAPRLITYAPLWSAPAMVPSAPFERLRFYEDTWHTETRRLAPHHLQRRLILEYPPL